MGISTIAPLLWSARDTTCAQGTQSDPPFVLKDEGGIEP